MALQTTGTAARFAGDIALEKARSEDRARLTEALAAQEALLNSVEGAVKKLTPEQQKIYEQEVRRLQGALRPNPQGTGGEVFQRHQEAVVRQMALRAARGKSVGDDLNRKYFALTQHNDPSQRFLQSAGLAADQSAEARYRESGRGAGMELLAGRMSPEEAAGGRDNVAPQDMWDHIRNFIRPAARGLAYGVTGLLDPARLAGGALGLSRYPWQAPEGETQRLAVTPGEFSPEAGGLVSKAAEVLGGQPALKVAGTNVPSAAGEAPPAPVTPGTAPGPVTYDQLTREALARAGFPQGDALRQAQAYSHPYHSLLGVTGKQWVYNPYLGGTVPLAGDVQAMHVGTHQAKAAERARVQGLAGTPPPVLTAAQNWALKAYQSANQAEAMRLPALQRQRDAMTRAEMADETRRLSTLYRGTQSQLAAAEKEGATDAEKRQLQLDLQRYGQALDPLLQAQGVE